MTQSYFQENLYRSSGFFFDKKFSSKLKLDKFAKKPDIKGWSLATVKVMKQILKRNIHAFRKEAKLMKSKKKINKKQQ